jgi:hypothetical protein
MDNGDIFRNQDDNTIDHLAEPGHANEQRQFRDYLKRSYGDVVESTAGFLGEAGEWLKEYFTSVGRCVLIPFTAATTIRRSHEGEPLFFDDHCAHGSAEMAGLATDITSYFAMVIVETDLIIKNAIGSADNNSWIYPLAAVAATNLADWLIYEPIHKAWKEYREDR